MNRAHLAGLWLLAACLSACKEGPEAMQTIVLIDAERGVRESLAGEVYVSRSTDNELLHTLTLPPRTWPIKFVLAPEAKDAQRRFSVTFSNMSGVPFGFELSAGFVAGRTRTLHVQIADSCVAEESKCRVGCGLIDITSEAMQASADMNIPITCKSDPDAAMNETSAMAGTGGTDANSGDGTPNMINVGARAGSSATAGSKAPAAGSGGGNPAVAGKGAPPTAGSGPNPPTGTDPCGPDTCGTHGKCATDGSCACDLGFVSAGVGKACTDVDECQQSPRPCGGGQCVNVDGDFSCECSGETWAKVDKHSCGRFSPPEVLTPKYSSAVPCQPQVAFYGASADQPGKGLAIWITGDSTQALWSASFEPGKGWTLASAPITLGVTDLDSPRLLLNPTTGDGFAIWTQNGGSEIRYALRREGKFAPSASLSVVEGAVAAFLSAAISTNGDGYATWTELSGDSSSYRSRVMSARYLGRTTQTWVGKTAIAGSDSENAAVSRVAVDGQGRATLVWTAAPIADGGTPSFIGKSYAARYDPNATTVRTFWSSGDLDSLASGLADVSFEAGGKGVSIWQRQALSSSAGIAVAASRYVGAAWVGPSSVSSTSEFTLMLPRVGVMPSGAAFAMWTQQSAGALNVYGSMLDASSGKWTSPATSLSPQSSMPPPFMSGWGDIYFDLIDLAVDEVGGGVGVFSEFNNTNRVIRAVHTHEGTKAISAPIEVVRDTTPIKPSRVEVGLDAQGAGALIWDQPITTMPPSYQVFVSRIE